MENMIELPDGGYQLAFHLKKMDRMKEAAEQQQLAAVVNLSRPYDDLPGKMNQSQLSTPEVGSAAS